MNSAVCPADSITSTISSKVLSLVEIVRNALLKQSIEVLTAVLKNKIIREDDLDEDNANLSSLCLKQILADVSFIRHCFFNDLNDDQYSSAKDGLDEIQTALLSLCDEDMTEELTKKTPVNSAAIEMSNLFLSNLFGKDHPILNNNGNVTDMEDDGDDNSHILLPNPLESSRRFVLLPIQSEKQINDLELRSAFGNNHDEEEAQNKPKVDSTGVGKGFGFFSSMLKKK